MRKPDWDKLVSATLLAQINQEYSLFLRVSYLLRFPEGFPVFKLIEKDGYENIIKFRTKSLMRWLIENDYTTLSMYDIQQAGRKFTMEQNALDNLFNEAYNEPCENIFLNEHEGEDNEQPMD